MKARLAGLVLLLGLSVGAQAQVTLSVAPSTIAAGNDVTITWSGMTGPTATDWVGLFVPGAANNNYKAFRYLNNQAAGSLPFSVPGTVGAGNYEMRIFRNNTYVLQATSNPLAVTTSLTVSPTSGVLGGTVTATWTGIPSPTATDWLGFYALGMPDQPYISFRYTTGAAAGNVPFSIPSSLTAAGPFELRLFSNNTWTKLATSNSFTVNVSIAGTITSGGSALAGVALTATGGGTCTNTNASGQYTCTVPRGWWGSVTPALAGYAFTPPSKTYSDLTANQTAQNYTAVQVRQVSGALTLGGAPFAGAVLTATNGGTCVPSNASGQYVCTVPLNWSGSVTPAKNGYVFTPASRNYTNVTANQTAQDYTSAAPGALASIYFVHVDHLGTSRLIANSQQQAVWRWEQLEPFGDAQPDENPSSLGVFEYPLRFPGQYADKETNLAYNYFRDCYDPVTGRYCQSDPIGLAGGLNSYLYALGVPIFATDVAGLAVNVYCRPVFVSGSGYFHCFVYVMCPEEKWSERYSMFANFGFRSGHKERNARDDDPATSSLIGTVGPNACFPSVCGYEKSVRSRFNRFPSGDVFYRPRGPNSNSFVNGLLMGRLPTGAPGSDLAPGIDIPHPGFLGGN